MKFLDNIINAVGKNVVVVGCIVLIVVIFAIVISRALRLRKYRKEIVELENEMNAIKTLPIQYRLGRVKGIAKNMPDVKEQYDEYAKEYEDLNELQSQTIATKINEIDEKLFTRHLKSVKTKLNALKEDIHKYETDSKALLKKIEVITEIENVQRLSIIKIKEKYRSTNDLYATVRFKVEDYVPAVNEEFKSIDTKFMDLEELMNNQEFDDAKNLSANIQSQIENLDEILKNLPTYISVARQYIPKRLEEISVAIESMKERNFAIERLNTTIRFNKMNADLENVVKEIKSLDLETVASDIEVITAEMNGLTEDFENEEKAYQKYHDKKDNCFHTIDEISNGLNEMMASLAQLKENYILDHYSLNIEEDMKGFDDIQKQKSELENIISSLDFSYSSMIEDFDDIIEKCKPYQKTLIKYNELETSLRLEEKRALEELENINIVLLEIKSEIKNKHLPMINDSYKDYIEDSYQKADAILNFIKQRPIDLESLSTQVDAARDVIYKLYDNVHNLIVTAEMVEDAITFGNRYRSSFLEVNTELTKAELLFRNGEYTKALSTAVDIIEKIKPGSYEMLVNYKKPAPELKESE